MMIEDILSIEGLTEKYSVPKTMDDFVNKQYFCNYNEQSGIKCYFSIDNAKKTTYGILVNGFGFLATDKSVQFTNMTVVCDKDVEDLVFLTKSEFEQAFKDALTIFAADFNKYNADHSQYKDPYKDCEFK